MQTLKVSVSLPDHTHDDVQLHLSADHSDCAVVIALPARAARTAEAPLPPAMSDDDAYVLGGYAGI